MNWIRNNKFLAGFVAFMVIGVGALVTLLINSMGQYDQVSQDYNTQVTEMKRLQALQPYPDQDNLAKYQEVETGYKQAVDDLRTKMAAFEPPVQNPPFTPTEFQDHLRKVVDEKVKAADQYGIAYPTDFYMGFERYRNSLPEAAATPLLTTQLDNIEELVSILIRERVDKIGKVSRAILPQENGAAATPPPVVKGAPTQNQPVAGDLVAKLPVVLDFSGPPTTFGAVLNDITHSKRLFIVRALKITNQSDKGPPRGQEPPAGGVSAAPAPASAEANPGEPLPEKGPPPLRYVVGQEKIDAVARIELAKVAPLR